MAASLTCRRRPPKQLAARPTHRGTAGDDELVFTADEGGRISASKLMSRVLKPAAVRAGLGEWRIEMGKNGKPKRRAESWVGFHTFRHTCATRLFANGWNAKQVQVWLGHHKPSFTLDTYVHLLDADLPEPTFFDVRVGDLGGNLGATQAAETGRTAELPERAASGL